MGFNFAYFHPALIKCDGFDLEPAMNAPAALVLILVVFGFAYRFYAKFLASGVFGLDTINNSIAPASPTGAGSHRITPAMALLSQHVGLIATALTISTVAVAVVWGWVPAFLWIIIGSTVAGGTYGFGVMWLSARHPGQGLGTVMQSYLPAPIWSATLLLALLLLTALNATLLVIVAHLLVNHASIVLPFWSELLLAAGFGAYLRRRPATNPWLVVAAAAIAVIALVLLLGTLPLGFSGEFNLDIAGTTAFSVDASLGWMVLLLAAVVFLQRIPVSGMLRPYALVSTGQFALVLLALLLGMLILHPPMIAPQFHAPASGPGVLPWLFLTISGGAIAGITLLFASTFSAPLVRQTRELRIVGYGGALAEGVIAVSALLVYTTGLDSSNWNTLYSNWNALLDPSYLLEVYVNGGAYFGGALGLSAETASTFTALALAALTFVSLDAGVRLQIAVFTETGRRFIAPSPDPKPDRIPWGVLLLIAIAVLTDARGVVPSTWLVFASANAVTACLGLLLVAAALRREGRSSLAVSGPLVLMLVLTLWSLIAALGYWWHRSAWVPTALDLLLLGLGGWISLQTVRILTIRAEKGA
jgi:carbon starvation protein